MANQTDLTKTPLASIFSGVDSERQKALNTLEDWINSQILANLESHTGSGGGDVAAVGGVLKTVLDFGADPTGKKDSSDAFHGAATTGTVFVPPGTYQINKTVKYGDKYKGKTASRAVMVGLGKNHFGSYTSRYSVFAGKDLKGFMFEDTYVVKGIPFVGREDKSSGKLVRAPGALDAGGYCDRISDCSFNNFEVAIRFRGGAVDVGVSNNQFVGNTYPWYAKKSEIKCTVSRFEDNTCQYCDNCGTFEDQVWSTRFVGNTYERIKGDGLMASCFYDCVFINNWWENRNGGSQGAEIVKVTDNQQGMRNFAQGNYAAYGWDNVFEYDEEGRNGLIGGTKLEDGIVRVSNSIGHSMRLTEKGLFGSQADWAVDNPLVIQSGITTKRNGRIQDIALRMPGRGGNVVFDSVIDSLGKGAFQGRVKFTREVNDKGEVAAEDTLRLNRQSFNDQDAPGFIGKTELVRKGKAVEGIIGIPIQFTWFGNSKSRGLDIFTKVTTGEGWVKFEADFRFDNPMLHITPEDRGIYLDGIEWSGGKESSTGRYHEAFTVYFVDRDKKPKTPKCFSGQLQTHYKLT